MQRIMTPNTEKLLGVIISILVTNSAFSMNPIRSVVTSEPHEDGYDLIVNESAAQKDLQDRRIADDNDAKNQFIIIFEALRDEALEKLYTRNRIFPWNWWLTEEEFNNTIFPLDENKIISKAEYINRLPGLYRNRINPTSQHYNPNVAKTLLNTFKAWRQQGLSSIQKKVTRERLGWLTGLSSTVSAILVGDKIANISS